MTPLDQNGTLVEDADSTDAPAAAEATPAADPAVQSQIDEAVAKFAAEHGIEISQPEAQSALDALKGLAEDAEHSTFAEKLEKLADEGYQAVVKAEDESPLVKTLITVVGELVGKVA
jgi:isopropylmalate/homocitrate/citramalate synthase